MSIVIEDNHNRIFNSKKSLNVIKAVAGSGKTTTMLEMARRNPSKKYIYISYNRATANEIKGKAPSNVFSYTFHSIAARKYLNDYKDKYTKKINVKDVLDLFGLKISKENVLLARAIIERINFFQNSSFKDINDVQIKYENVDNDTLKMYSSIFWDSMIDKESSVPIFDDTYLKLFHLNEDTIDGLNIIFDEAQDASDVMVEILKNQLLKEKNLYVVGDENQSIYGFRYANNAMSQFESMYVDKEVHVLDKTYRFGSEIARAANSIIELKGKQNFVRVVGSADRKDILVKKISNSQKMAIISRKNETLLDISIKASDIGKSMFFVGGFDSYDMSRLIDLEHFYFSRKRNVKSIDILDYGSFKELEKVSFLSQDYSMMKLISIVKSYAGKIENKIEQIKSKIVPIEYADIVLTNAHKSKGLEFDNVFLCNDFKCFFDKNGNLLKNGENFNEELNLLYVAATRARKRLRVNTSLEQILNKK